MSSVWRNIYLVVKRFETRLEERLGPILRRPWRLGGIVKPRKERTVLFSSEIFARNSRERGSEILYWSVKYFTNNALINL